MEPRLLRETRARNACHQQQGAQRGRSCNDKVRDPVAGEVLRRAEGRLAKVTAGSPMPVTHPDRGSLDRGSLDSGSWGQGLGQRPQRPARVDDARDTARSHVAGAKLQPPHPANPPLPRAISASAPSFGVHDMRQRSSAKGVSQRSRRRLRPRGRMPCCSLPQSVA